MENLYTGLDKLEERILRGLEMEWRIGIHSLKIPLRRKMRMPGFELRNLDTTWGLWEGNKRNIVLSRKLVLEYPWKSVREVLRHEMAHQAAEQVFGEYGQPHGKAFKEACRMLGADSRATGTFPSIYEMPEQEDLNDSDRIMLRVKKLLAMAQSSNKNEAELAMAKAHEHIARYNIDLLSMDRERTYCSICLGEPSLRNPLDAYALAELLRSFYFVQTIWLSMYVVRAMKPGSILEISGTADNVKLAEYAHDFLRRTIDAQWKLFRKQNSTGYRKTDFALGLIAGFSEKLADQTRRMEAGNEQTRALMEAGDRRLAAYFRERYSSIRTIGRRGRLPDETAHAAGHAAGRKTILHKPVEKGSAPRGKLLTG